MVDSGKQHDNYLSDGDDGSGSVMASGSIHAQYIAGRDLTVVYGDDDKAAERYLRALFALHSPIRNRYIDLQATAPFNQLVEDPLIPPELRLLEEGETEGCVIESIQDVLHSHPKLVMLGEPGAGKTTSMRVLLADAAEAHLRDPVNFPLPIYIELGAWGANRPNDILDYARQRLEYEGLHRPPLARALWLLDGLNEMAGKSLTNRINSIRQLLREYKSATIVTTCRLADYTSDLDLDLPFLTVQPLDEDRIRRFLQVYLGDQIRTEMLWNKLQTGYGLWRKHALIQLARNPYLLTILVQVYRAFNTLPDSQGELFHRLVVVLWARERARQHPVWFEKDVLEQALGELAYRMIEEQAGTSVPKNWALDCLSTENGEALLRLADRASLIVAPHEGDIRFYHQLMQEYFAAQSLWRRFLADEDLRGVWGRVGVGPWDEVVVTLSGLLKKKEASEFIRTIAESNPFLASYCLTDGPARVDTETRTMVIDALVSTLGDRFDWVRETAAKALERLHWRPTDKNQRIKYLIAKKDWQACVRLGQIAVEELIRALQDRDTEVRESAAQALCKIKDPQATRPLIAGLWDSNSRVRQAAAQALDAIGWQPASNEEQAYYLVSSQDWEACVELDGAAVEPLITALRDRNATVRRMAARTLSQIGAPAAIPLTAMLKDRHVEVRRVATQALGNIGAPAIPPLIAVVRDPDSDLRHAAVKALEQTKDTQAIEALLEALEDEYDLVREAAARALGGIGSRLEHGARYIRVIVPLMKKLDDEYSNVRYAASSALDYLGWQPTSNEDRARYLVAKREWQEVIHLGAIALPPLKAISKDRDLEVRQAVAETLGKIGHIRAISPLVAALDDSRWVSKTAADALLRIGTPEALAALREHGFDHLIEPGRYNS